MPTIISGDTGVNQITAGAIEFADLPTGSVLQVVQGSTSTQVTVSDANEYDTGLTATITPKFTTSKILVIINQADCAKIDVQGPIQFSLFRNSTRLYYFASQLLYQSSGAATRLAVNCAGSYLDSPATTSAVTYKTRFSSLAGGSTTRIQFTEGAASTIQLLEIAG